MSGGKPGILKLPCWDGRVGKVGKYVMRWVGEKYILSLSVVFLFLFFLLSSTTSRFFITYTSLLPISAGLVRSLWLHH